MHSSDDEKSIVVRTRGQSGMSYLRGGGFVTWSLTTWMSQIHEIEPIVGASAQRLDDLSRRLLAVASKSISGSYKIFQIPGSAR